MKSSLKIVTLLASIYLSSNCYADPIETFSITYVNDTNYAINYINDYAASGWSQVGDFTGAGVLSAHASVTFNSNIYDHHDGGYTDPKIDYLMARFSPTEQRSNQLSQYYWVSIVNPISSPSSYLTTNNCSNPLSFNDLEGYLLNYAGGETQDGFIENSYGPTNNYTIDITGWETTPKGYQTLSATLSLENGISTNTYFVPCLNNNNSAAAVAD